MLRNVVCPLCKKLLKPLIIKTVYLESRVITRCQDYSTNKIPHDLKDFTLDRVRNFSIIAHVDHGKSTLADRILELTDVIPSDVRNAQVLDRLQVERERGITVKAQTASLFYDYGDIPYLLNLIDTPGHVDFNYEVSRSLSACQGVILLVDANQGVQAQTVANFFLAFEHDLQIIPVLNKIDLKLAKPGEVTHQLSTLFDIQPQTVLKISAKKGTGIKELLDTVIEKIPPPVGDRARPLKGLVFDSWYDQFRGAIVDVAVKDGVLTKGEKIVSAHSSKTYEVQEVGIKYPTETPTDVLYAGQVGYIVAGMKNTSEAQIGDTIYHQHSPVEPLPGFKPAKPMVFAGIFPSDQSEFNNLRSALNKLTLNDASVSVHSDSSAALGQGWRLGFLGLLHMDVFTQRLEQEHNASLIVTSPNVPYKVKISGAKNIKSYGEEEVTILNPCHLPPSDIVKEYSEPMVLGTVISPDDYLNEVMSLCAECRGEQKEMTYIDNKRFMLKVILPLNEILVNFFDDLKSVTSGYASFDYEDYGYRVSDLVKLTVLINGNEVEELTTIAHLGRARTMGKQICARLKESIPRQLFKIALQAAVGGKIVAREDIQALKKDVLAKCYGGDITRKQKLLRRQAEGKKKMRAVGNIQIPKDAFIKVLRR